MKKIMLQGMVIGLAKNGYRRKIKYRRICTKK